MISKSKAVFIIPYFGKKPDYFELWLKSAEKNRQYNFYIYTDIDLKTSRDSNVKVITTCFSDLVGRFRKKLGDDIKLATPYKLCDYKPAYGLVFEEDIKDYLFWGYCDVDLIFGDISNFITDDMLCSYDKFYFHGHFTLFRNNELMRQLFKEKFSNVLDYTYAFHTDYVCHFDENGTVAYASDYRREIQTYFNWDFCDPAYNSYELIWGDRARYGIWENGILNLYGLDGKDGKEILYLHLQKRKMHYDNTIMSENTFAIIRDKFISLPELNNELTINSDEIAKKQNHYRIIAKKSYIKNVIKNIMAGSLGFKTHSKKMQLRKR